MNGGSWTEVHCEHCMCPKEEWKRTLRTFTPEDETLECQLFGEVFSAILDLEFKKQAFTLRDIVKQIKTYPNSSYPEHVFNFTIAEIIEIYQEEGYMPDCYTQTIKQLKKER